MKMKTIGRSLLPILACCCLLNTCFAQSAQTNTAAAGITFPVCEVKPADTLLAEIPYEEALRRYVLPEHSEYDDEGNKKPVINPPVLESSSHSDQSVVVPYFHPFVQAAHMAYAEHRPLAISPDMVWLMIVQGFVLHVNENAQALRKRFVDFEGKTNLDVRRDDFVKGDPNNDWESVFPEFSDQIGDYTGKTLKDLVVANFSTTGNLEKAAFEVSLMDAMDHYFTYSFSTMCGIPEIRLEGTPADWALIEQKAQQLGQYDLDWWMKDLLPILKEFTAAANGQVNREFWQNIFKYDYIDVICNEEPSMTGWVVKFFPYLPGFKGERDELAGRNPLVDVDMETFFKEGRSGRREYMGPKIGTGDFSSGLSKAEFLMNDHGHFYKMAFHAGFIGIEQDHATKTLRPKMGWAVVDMRKAPSKKEVAQYWKTQKLPRAAANKD